VRETDWSTVVRRPVLQQPALVRRILIGRGNVAFTNFPIAQRLCAITPSVV
jgi:hypothetical protein